LGTADKNKKITSKLLRKSLRAARINQLTCLGA
jgi:hypothetical protein